MKQIPIFRVTGTFLVLVFLCSVLFGCGGTGSAADDAYLTQVTASVTEAQSLIDEMISFSNEMTEATGTFSEKDTAEYYKRVTDRSSYTTRDIVRYVNGHYEMVNEISPEMMLRMRNSLTSEDEEIFNKDMQILEDFMSHKVC